MPKLLLEDVEEIYTYLGIVTALPDHKLAYHLNKKLKIALETDPKDLKIKHLDGYFVFPILYFGDIDHQITWHLLRNKAACFSVGEKEFEVSQVADKLKKSIFVKSLQQYDFLLVISGLPTNEDIKMWQREIRQISGVSFVSPCQPKENESKNLFFEAKHESE